MEYQKLPPNFFSETFVVILLDTNNLENSMKFIPELEYLASIIIIDHHEKPEYLHVEKNETI